jgi:hypothetical protein
MEVLEDFSDPYPIALWVGSDFGSGTLEVGPLIATATGRLGSYSYPQVAKQLPE